ncbi:Phytochrome-like protein cph2 [compost metagenome]
MTSIANRRQFDVSFELEWKNARNHHQPLSMLMFDIDFFKQYNDLYGHIRGDKCLVDIAQTLNLALDGMHDMVARFGGEEFVVLLPQTDAAVALKVAERCQRLVYKRAIDHAQSPHGQRLTVSIGVGTVTPNEQMQPASFIEAVDAQLYAAKKKGRNRIEVMPLAV